MLSDNCRILVLPSGYPTKNAPSSGTFSRDHINVLKRISENIEVIYVDFGKSNSSIKNKNCVLYHVNIPFRKTRILYPYYFLIWFFLISRSFIKRKPNLIIAHAQRWAGFMGNIVSLLTNTPLIFINHSAKIYKKYKLRWFLDLLISRTANYIWFVSSAQATSFKHEFKIRSSITVGNPVNTEYFIPSQQQPPSVPKILYVGRPTYHKGIDILTKSLSSLRDKEYKFEATILCDPAYFQDNNYLSLLDRLNVEIIPYLPKKEYREKIYNSSFIALPSRYESFSYVAAEAISCGKPVVVTRCGGPEWFVTEDVGFLCEPDSVESFTNGLSYMLENYQNYDPWKLHKHIEDRFSYEKVAEKMRDIISEVFMCNLND